MPPATPWPKLSEQLPNPGPHACARCLAEPGRAAPGSAETRVRLIRWREHDEHDQPTDAVVVLCEACAGAIIDAHPRLYSRMQEHEPHPGSMTLCLGCRHRRGTACAHPDLKINGGAGLRIVFPEPSQAFIDYRDADGRRRGRAATCYTGPPTSCAGREEGAP